MAETNNNAIKSVLLTEKQLDEIVTRLAGEIEAHYSAPGKNLLMICVLKGSLIFTADLMRKINLPMKVDFMQASSYGSGTVSCGNVKIRLDLKEKDLSQYDILVVEDILDSGNTLSFLLNYLKERAVRSVKLCVLLNKPERRKIPIEVDFEGAKIADEFVVGYGLDYNEQYRNLPYVGILKPEVYGG